MNRESKDLVASSFAVKDSTIASNVLDVFRSLHGHHYRVHALTNIVATNLTANTILALGGVPSMTDLQEEMVEAVKTSDALLVNLGTPSKEKIQALQLATETAKQYHKPWVLDPVFVEKFSLRLLLAKNLIALRPHIIRGNHHEMRALLASYTDANHSQEPLDVATHLARISETVIVSTGEIDIITDGTNSVSSSLGSPMQALTTGMGCALGAILATLLAMGSEDTFAAAIAGIVLVGTAAQQAELNCQGPGSFPAAFLDMLYELSCLKDTDSLSHVLDHTNLRLLNPIPTGNV